MKEHPILFSAPMVQAILDGRKTQTRRAVKPQPTHFNPPGVPRLANPEGSNYVINCPFGVPSDRLWVRETFFAWGRWETRYNAKKGRDEWHFVDMTLESEKQYHYEQSPPPGYKKQKRAGAMPAWWKRPSIFTPRHASRLMLEIESVRVERLRSITVSDAIAEGYDGSIKDPIDPSIKWFANLWDSINGAGAFDINPWVWAISFRRV
jgi:hypothetical protein